MDCFETCLSLIPPVPLQGILGSRDSLPIKAQELLGGQSPAKRSASSIHSESTTYGPAAGQSDTAT